MAQKQKYCISVLRDRRGHIFIRFGRDGLPDADGDVELIDALYGEDEAELRVRAKKFVEELRASR